MAPFSEFFVLRSVRLFQLADVPVSLHFSWYPAFLFIAGATAETFIPRIFPAWSRAHDWAVAVAITLLLFASLVAHELSHALVAKRRKLAVIGITLFFLGGVAEIDVDEGRPTDEFYLAVAGPATSAVLAGAFYGAWLVLAPRFATLALVTLYLALSNALIAGFNLIPAYPLDGGRIVHSGLWQIWKSRDRATTMCTRVARITSVLWVVGGIALCAHEQWASGIWLILVAGFLILGPSLGSAAPPLPSKPGVGEGQGNDASLNRTDDRPSVQGEPDEMVDVCRRDLPL